MYLEQFIQGDDSVQRLVASEREKHALVAVSPMARKAIQQEILPQIEGNILSIQDAETSCKETKQDIKVAFSCKNEIYIRLSQYKGIDQSDDQFCEDLLVVMDEWLENTTATLEAAKIDETATKTETETETETQKVESPPEKQEIEITVKVEPEPEVNKNKGTGKDDEGEGEGIFLEDVSLEDLSLKDTDDGPKVEIDPAGFFDLGDVRL